MSLVLVVAWHAAGCRLPQPDNRPKVVIQFGMDPDGFEGLPVIIDGKVAGKLERFGDNPRTAFLVDKGEHQVSVRHPTLVCDPVKVDATYVGQRIELMLDVGQQREGKPVLVLIQ